MIRFENFKPLPSQIIGKVACALPLMIILLFSIFTNPEKANFSKCYFQELTGLPCPTCGLIHSFYAASHLHLIKSFKFHLMGPIIFLIILLIIPNFSNVLIFGLKIIASKSNPVQFFFTAHKPNWV